ncbi:MAG: hypothetical protein HON76_21925 [Candidatus Scalindua sp.]|jgi:hypothetical protein|nr:hypothetical protein [Candidatus Scalindua sp.]MBT5307279.1 hypothetical protein [Candidatus Scalindua sp.]MBT6048963.1 hypothetical protein [Candidatus Scalindua sp.]MBT6226617.1 hypothetical protein [Candidatus Scalindua sp.]MBT6565172.1 hypothetical protein [Candidatus Scalindua sp.]
MRIKSKLRFGVMLHGNMLEEWQKKSIDYLLSMNNVTLELFIIDTRGPDTKNNSFDRYLYSRYRASWFNKTPRRKDKIDKQFSEIPIVKPLITKKGKFSEYFDEESVKAIREYELDFIMRYGFNIIRGDILKAAHYGVWSFHHDDERKYTGSPAGFWEIYHNDPVNGAILQKINEILDNGIILKRGFFKTINYSYVRNINMIYFESAKWPAWVCKDILNGKDDFPEDTSSKSKGKIYYPPGNLKMIIFFIKLFKNYLKHLCKGIQQKL